MTDPKDLPPDFTDLRRRAEAQLELEAIPPEELSPDQAARLIHELRVYQIELEMQNDELRRSQALLEESRSQYADLYDFAPVGYLTLDSRGKIVEANLTAATLLGVERRKLVNRFFSHFLVEADRQVFRQLMNNGLNHMERRGEFHLQDGNGDVRVMLLNILSLTDVEGRERHRISMTDITELKRTQEELRLHKEDLEELVAERTAELIQVNEQLREANDNLEALFQAAPLAIVAFDAEGKVTNINPACERILGWSLEDVQGRLPLSIPKESPEESLALLQRLLGGESVAGLVIKQQRKDGSLFDASVSAAPLRDAQGKIRGFVGLAEDITERKKLEEDVRTQALVLKNMAEGVTVTDQRGQIIYTNPAFDAMFGYEPGELVGHHSNALNFYPPEENLAVVKEILDQVNTTGLWTGELHNCRKNGKPFFTSTRISPITAGGKKLYISVQEDITQRKRAQEMLQRQAELLDLAHDAILVRDIRGRILYWNQGAAHHYGWTQAEAMGQISHKLLQTVFPQPLLEIKRHLLEHGFWEGELTHTTRQGQNLVMNSRWTAKRDDEGRVVAILEIGQDITAQKQIEQEVHRLASFPLLNPNPVIEADEDGHILYANPAARQVVEQLRLNKGLKAFLPPDLKKKFAATHKGGPRQYAFDLPLKDRVYTVMLSFPHDLPTARVYALDITERKLAEEALQKSEGRFRKLVEANIVGIVVSDEEKIIEANDEFLRLVGYTRDEMLAGRVKWVEMTPREYIPQDAKALYELKSTGAHTPFEKTFLRKDGGLVPVVVGGALLEEEPLSWVSFVLDITERKQLDDSLRVSEARFRAIFTNASIGIATTDLTGRLQEFNAPVMRGLGYTPTELRSMSFLDIAHPDDLAVDKDLFTELAVGKRDRYQVEKRYVCKDGRVLWGRLHVSLVRGPRGEPQFTVALVEDITARKESQAALEESEARYRSLVDLSPDAILVHAKGKYIFANPAGLKLFGAASPQDLLGRPALELVHPDSQDTVKRRVNTGERLDLREVRILRLDGQAVEVEVAATPIRYRGQPAVQVMLRDITARKAAVEALRQSEAREQARAGELQAILDTTPGIILLAHDPQGRVITGNRAAYELLRRTPGRNLSKSAGESKKPENFRTMKDGREVPGEELPVQRAAAGETVRDYELDIVFDDGTVRHILGDAVPLLDEAGQPRGAVAAFLDITDRKQAEEALAQKQAEFEAIFHSISDGIVFTDTQRHIAMVNPAAEALFGYSPEEMQGSLTDFLYASQDDFEKQGRLRYHSQPGQPQPVYEITYRRKDGSVFPAEARGGQVKDTQDRVLGFVSINRDITERKKAEAALRESEGHFRQVVESLPQLVWTTEPDGTCDFLSKQWQEYSGLPEAGQLGYGWLYQVHPDDQAGFMQAWKTATATGSDFTMEFRLRRHDGVYHWFDTRAVALRDEDGAIVKWFGSNTDIHAQRELREALQEREERLRLFIEHAPAALAMFDREMRYLHVSRRWLQDYGLGEKDVLGRSHYEVFPDIPPEWKEVHQRGLAGEVISSDADRFLRRDGSVQWLRWEVRPWYGADGEVAGIVIFTEDITARQQAEEALRESREDLNRAQAVAHIGSWRLNVQKNELTWSDETHRIFGIPQGTPLTYEAFLAAVHPEDRESLDRIWATALKGEPYDIEHRIVVNGTVKWLRELAELEFDSRDQLLGGFGTVQDITQRKLAEEAVKRHQALQEGVNRVLHAALTSETEEQLGEVCLAVAEELTGSRFGFIGELNQEWLSCLAISYLGWEVCKIPGSEALVLPKNFPVKGVYGVCLREGRPELTNDPANHPESVGWPAGHPPITGFLGVPLKQAGQTIGMIGLGNKEGGFTVAEQEIVEALAPAIVEAFQRKRAEEDLRRSNQRLDLLAETAGRLLVAESSHQLVDSLCQKVMEFLNCDLFFNFLVDTPGERLHLNACGGIPEEEKQRLEWLDYGVAVCGCVAQEAFPIVCEDIQNTQDQRTELVKAFGVQAFACHPLKVGDRVLGTLAFGTRKKTSFSTDDLALMNAVADQVAIAMDRQQAEEALRQSEARYRGVGELIPFGIWTAAPDGGWEYVSKSFLKTTGKTLEECQGFGWLNLLPQEAIKPTLKAWQNSLETGGFWDHEYKIRGRDDCYHTVLSRGLPLSDSQGRITSWVGINLDISERKEMEEALRRAHDELEVRVEERTAALRLANEQLLREIEERQEIQDKLQDSEARFTAFMEHLPGLAVMRDVEGHYLYANLAWEESMGLEQGAWQGKVLSDLWAPERAKDLEEMDFQIISSGKPREQVEVQVLADGPHQFLTSRFPIKDAKGLPYMVGAIAIDVTDRQRAEQQLAETGRLYRVLSQVNEAIIRGRDQEALFAQVCRIVVEEGLFRMAWVGLTDPASQTVRVAAKYGFDEGYLDNLAVSLGDGAESQGPTGTAIREGRFDICNDFATDPRMAPWREQALARDYRSSGAFPLRIGDKVVGALTLYAYRPEFFTDKEIDLLTSLADNLSFALEFLDREAKRRQAEEALAAERQRFLDLLEHLPAFVYLQAPDYSLRFANREFRQRFGEANGKACYSLLWGRDEPCPDCPTFTVFHTGIPREWEWNAPDGRVYQVYDYPFADVDGSPLVLEMGTDITERKRAEEALAEQAMLVQDLYNNAPCGYHSLDSEGFIAQINDTELAWLGYSRDEVVGRLHFSDLLTPDSRKIFEHTFPEFKARGWVKDIEYELVRKDGTVFPVNLSATAVTDEAGNYLMSRSSMFDITDRKQAEVALTAERQRLFALMEQIPAYVTLLAPDYTVPYTNREYVKRFGEAEEGQTCYEFLFGSKEPCPDCRTFKVLETNQPQEWEWLGPDGRTYAVYDYPFTDADGSPLILEMGLDITDRKRAEEALKQNEAMLRLILDTLPVGVWVTDREGRIIEGNPAARRIWGGARYVGLEEYGEYWGWWADTGKKIEPEEWALARAIQKGETSLGEVINIRCFDGTRKTIINSGVPLFGENQEILGAIVVNQDITEMVRAEEVIREQGRQMQAFFAHSITPLVFLDQHFNFLRVNEAYARACQRNAQEFIGHNHFEFFPHAENQAIFAEVVRSKTPYQVQAKPFEFPDHPEWGVTYWDWSLVPILDQAGEVDFLVFSLRDVTRRVLSEQARNRLIEILEATPDFVGIADFYGHLQYLNRAGRAMVGVGEDEDVSRLRVTDLHPEEVGKLILEKGSSTAIKEGAWQVELSLLHRDGREIPVSQVILAHKDPAGRVQFFSTVARDITDMKEAQASILRQTAILNGINKIFRETLTCETAADLGQTCLSIAEALTDSEFGFITEINQQNRLDALAMSDPKWQSCGLQPAQDLSHVKDLEPAGLLARPIRENKAVIANDPSSQPDWAGTLGHHSPLTAYLGMPLIYGGKILGLLGLGNKEGGYTLTDQEAVESLAPAIVEALMHHRAEQALKSSERKLRYLADQLLTAQENERKRLAAELHDELGHALLALKLHLSSIEKKLPPELEDVKEEIRGQLNYIHEVIQDVRRLYHDLSPGDVEDLGITRALRTLINDFAGNFPQITWQVDLADLEGLFSLPVQTTIYRIVQEALTNIGKHANPSAVTISSTKENHQVHFIVQDNGAGFDVAQELGSRSSGRGLGLVAMEERLNMVGGSFEIQSRKQEGTRLSFTIPVIPEGERP